MNISNPFSSEDLLKPRHTNDGARQVRERHLSNLGDQFLNQIEPAQAREILFRQIAKRLSHMGGPPLTEQAGTSLPQQLVNHGVSLQQQGQTAADIRQALQHGLQSGLDLLSRSPLNSTTGNSVSQFEQQLAQSIQQSPLSSQYQHDSFSRENSASIEIRTQEGDIVRINISATQDQSLNSLAIAGRSAAAAIYQRNQEQSRQLHIDVEGNLSADELKSITTLLGKIDKLADKFYNGQDQAALASASNLRATGNIAGFDLNFRSAEQSQQSRTQVVGSEPLQFIHNLARESNDIIQQVKAFTHSDQEQLRSTVADIMHNMMQLKHPQQEHDSSLINLENLLKTEAQSLV